ncbi:hypothetical protein L1887_44193 [Cichorium endivia]|nr:hypothetical protein L1887_44193 [Cichorium endivia]
MSPGPATISAPLPLSPTIAEKLAHHLATTAPGNQGLQIDYATLLQARGLPRAAEQKLKKAEALEPSNLELEQQQAYVAMDLQEWRQMDLLADDVLARAPADRSARRLDRLRTVHHMSELRLNASKGLHSDNPVSGTHDLNWDATLYGPSLADKWRLFAGTRYAEGNFDEGKGTSRHLLGGVEWRPRDLQLEAELSSNRYHGENKPGARLSTTYFVTDSWQVSGSLERLSRTTPLRALRNGISANRGEGGVRWYQNERREYQFSAALSRFSDHNRRQEYTLTGKERLWQTPSLTLDLEPGIAASKNSLRDTLYYNPARDLSVTAALAVDHEMVRHYDTLWSQQFVAGGGSYWQKNQSAGAIALLGYGQRVQWNNVIDTGVMLNWDKRPYDGKRESNLSVTANVCAQAISFIAPKDRPQLEASKPWPKNQFLVLAYHDVEDDAADQRYLSVRTSALNEQISWLLHNGYHAISVQDILDAHDGKKTLPPKAVLLSFDDGYSSFYTRVWPLLQAWNVPALWAPVGSWVDTPANQKVNFGGLMTPRDRFATWDMVRELSHSPLIEIGSHTWASHYGIPANPQGSREPAIANRFYDSATGRYETDRQFSQRIGDDVRKVTEKITQVTGKAPRAWVWPYGAANGTSLAIARQQGYQLAFTLEDGLGNVQDLGNIPRLLIAGNPSIKAFASTVSQVQERDPVRVMHVDLDYVYDPDPAQQTQNINRLIQRLQTRAGVKVFAWMPVLSFDLDPSLPRVQRRDRQTGQQQEATEPYIRLSPWDPQVRQQVTDIYEDLARYASFNGILFHDDAALTDVDDAGQNTTRQKSQTLIGLTHALSLAVKHIRGPQIKTARNMFALPILQPESEAWFAQNLDDFLAEYDWTVPMAMPLMESVPADESDAWLTRLVNAVAARPGALDKTIFELQARDWDQKPHRAVSDSQLSQWMRVLQLNGVKNYGYYPDDFINNQPDISRIRPEFSSYWYPDND